MTIEDIKNILNKSILNKVDASAGINSYKSKYNQTIFKQYKQVNSLNIFKNINEIIYLKNNINNLENLHIFCKCGKKNKFINYNMGYRTYCSKKCYQDKLLLENKDIYPNLFKELKCECCNKIFNADRKQIFKWINNYKQNKNVYITCSLHCTKVLVQQKIDKEKVKQKRKKTLYEKTGNPNYRNHEQAKRTLFKKYGILHNSQLPNFVEKVKNTKFIRYGNPNYNNKEKISKTIKTKHNVDWNSQTKEWKESMHKNKDIRMRKIYNSYKKNNSYKSVSKPELKCFKKLLIKFPDTIHTYMDKRYPFKCDFYIPSKDLFIECNYGLFHNKKPFDKNNNEHLKELEILRKACNEKIIQGNKNNRYKGIIYVWTDLDVRKLKTFIDNKLNYKIFYTEEEFDEWFDNL